MVELAPMFLAGLLGGAHCAGMCGGIVAALTGARGSPVALNRGGGVATPTVGLQQTRASVSALGLHLAYNGGRLLSYALAGLIAGGVGFAGVGLATQVPLRLVLLLLANLLLLAMALYLMGLPQFLSPLERLGAQLWRRIQPLTRRWLPVHNWRQALPLGLLWGWLPCGLVYTALATALAAGSPQQGALVMLVFGLGTLPNLLLAGLAAERLRALTARRWVRVVAGLLVMGLALRGLWGVAHMASRAGGGN